MCILCKLSLVGSDKPTEDYHTILNPVLFASMLNSLRSSSPLPPLALCVFGTLLPPVDQWNHVKPLAGMQRHVRRHDSA